MKLDIVVPTYNEEGNIKDFYEKTEQALEGIKHNYIFVNDGSKDKTLSKLKALYKADEEHIKIISFSKNFGKDAAIYAGLLHSKADYTCIISSDLSQNPNYLKNMYDFLNEHEEYDSVCMCQKQKKKFIQNLLYNFTNKLSDIEIMSGASDFRIFRKNMVNAILKISEKNRFSKGIFSYVGFNTYYDYYEPTKRKKAKQKNKSYNYAFEGITNFSTKPLKAATYTGIFISIVAFISLLIFLIKSIVNGENISDYAFLIWIILFIGGIQLIFLGIIGEYLGKTYNETKNRPIFIAKEKYGFDEDIL